MSVLFERGCLVLQEPAKAEHKSFLKFDMRRERWVAEPLYWRALVGASPDELWDDHPGEVFPEAERSPLRAYQREAADAWRAHGCQGCIELPTGAGKTRVALEWIARCRGRILVAVPTCVLLRQWERILLSSLRASVGIWGDGRFTDGRIVVTTFASALIYLLEQGDRFDFLVVDEAHHLGTERTSFVARLSTACARLGLSATFPAEGIEKERLADSLGPVVHSVSPKDLPEGVLAPFHRTVHRVELSPLQRSEMALLKKRMSRILARASQGLVEGIAPSWKQMRAAASVESGGLAILLQWRRFQSSLASSALLVESISRIVASARSLPTVVFCPNTQLAIRLSAALRAPCILSGVSAKERDFWLEKFSGREVLTLITCRVINEGYDLPDIERCIVVGASHSSEEYVQRIGRALRARGKKQVRVEDVVVEGTRSEIQSKERRQLVEERYGNRNASSLAR